MAIFKCKMCGAALEVNDETTATCEYCGTAQTLPKLNDEKIANLYDRANHFRRNNEYDRAKGIYEQILDENTKDAEAYWSLVLCKYGIEYVEDPTTRKRVPTVNRTQFTSVFDDDNYKKALEYADVVQKRLYEEEAKTINDIQKGILAISQQEEPFDVFICYKETDNTGRRTMDSVLAQELYNELTKEGFKVFFSRITLEDKLGTAYEPYIFAALNSAKVMVVVGTKPEHFNAVWVKNEWSRYLGLIKGGAKKTLIPAYKDMDPYDLPDEFSHLQAQDMNKLGFMQDLVRGIRKIAGKGEVKQQNCETKQRTGNASNAKVDSLLTRVFMFLEDEEWESAEEYCEKVLDIDPKNAHAYLGKLMAEYHCRKREELRGERIYNSRNYSKIECFGESILVEELNGYANECRYNVALEELKRAVTIKEYQNIGNEFLKLGDYLDSRVQREFCVAKEKELKDEEFKKIELEKQRLAELEQQQLKYKDIYQSNKEIVLPVEQTIAKLQADKKKLGLFNSNKKKEIDKRISDMRNDIAGNMGTLIEMQRKLWHGKIAAGMYHTVGVKADGSVLAVGSNEYRQLATYWKDIVAVAAGCYHTVGLKNDGTVVATGLNEDGQCNVSSWKNIIAVEAGERCTIGLRADGKVMLAGKGNRNEVASWNNIASIAIKKIKLNESVDEDTILALTFDGKLKYTGETNEDDRYYKKIYQQYGLASFAVGGGSVVGLNKNGTITFISKYGTSYPSEWGGIIDIAMGAYAIGLRVDGTVKGDCFGSHLSEWENIIAIAAGSAHIVGLKSDGTVVADTGSASVHRTGACSVSDWKLF